MCLGNGVLPSTCFPLTRDNLNGTGHDYICLPPSFVDRSANVLAYDRSCATLKSTKLYQSTTQPITTQAMTTTAPPHRSAALRVTVETTPHLDLAADGVGPAHSLGCSDVFSVLRFPRSLRWASKPNRPTTTLQIDSSVSRRPTATHRLVCAASARSPRFVTIRTRQCHHGNVRTSRSTPTANKRPRQTHESR